MFKSQHLVMNPGQGPALNVLQVLRVWQIEVHQKWLFQKWSYAVSKQVICFLSCSRVDLHDSRLCADIFWPCLHRIDWNPILADPYFQNAWFVHSVQTFPENVCTESRVMELNSRTGQKADYLFWNCTTSFLSQPFSMIFQSFIFSRPGGHFKAGPRPRFITTCWDVNIRLWYSFLNFGVSIKIHFKICVSR